jgi:trehalose 6-phosphate phosphatase
VTESSPATRDPLARALAVAGPVLRASPAGLLTDFDGTLSPIVEDPASARLAEGALDALTRLVERLAVVAVVTGRAPLDARRMVGVPELLVAGNHGTEWLEPGSDRPDVLPDAASVQDALAAVRDRLPALPGVTLEDKGLSATVHYRGAPDPDAARAVILDAVGDPGPGLELRPGRMSVEVRPVGLGDKGAATRRIIERFGLRGAVVMGDDVTDLDMFRVVADERAAGRLAGAIIGVGGAGGEVPPQVAEAADVVLTGPEEAARFLADLGLD